MVRLPLPSLFRSLFQALFIYFISFSALLYLFLITLQTHTTAQMHQYNSQGGGVVQALDSS